MSMLAFSSKQSIASSSCLTKQLGGKRDAGRLEATSVIAAKHSHAGGLAAVLFWNHQHSLNTFIISKNESQLLLFSHPQCDMLKVRADITAFSRDEFESFSWVSPAVVPSRSNKPHWDSARGPVEVFRYQVYFKMASLETSLQKQI